MALYIVAVFLVVLVASALVLHYGFAALGLLPDSGSTESVTSRSFFEVDYTFFLNLLFLGLSGFFIWWSRQRLDLAPGDYARLSETILFWLSLLAFLWLGGGLLAGLL